MEFGTVAMEVMRVMPTVIRSTKVGYFERNQRIRIKFIKIPFSVSRGSLSLWKWSLCPSGAVL